MASVTLMPEARALVSSKRIVVSRLVILKMVLNCY